MNLPPLQSPISASYHASGDVAIATDAVIAPGVVLMADPSAQIIIGAGACLGLGVVLHASQGAIVVEAGVSLGAGVLVVGRCRIGTQACVGASTTLHNVSVPPGQLVAPGSLLGETGRSLGNEAERSGVQPGVQAGVQADSGEASGRASPTASPWDEPAETEANAEKVPAEADAPATAPEPPPKKPTKVYGKAQFERMRVMFRPD